MTNPKPLFTAEDFYSFDPGTTPDGLKLSFWLNGLLIHPNNFREMLAQVANAKVAPLQDALSEMRLKCGEWANRVASQYAEIERLRAENASRRERIAMLEGECASLEFIAKELGDTRADNARLREALEFYATNDIHSATFDFRDNGAKARAALHTPQPAK